jgi:hypothetical protein
MYMHRSYFEYWITTVVGFLFFYIIIIIFINSIYIYIYLYGKLHFLPK